MQFSAWDNLPSILLLGNSDAFSTFQLRCHLHSPGRQALSLTGALCVVQPTCVFQAGKPLTAHLTLHQCRPVVRLVRADPDDCSASSIQVRSTPSFSPAQDTHPNLPEAGAEYGTTVHCPEPNPVLGTASHVASGVGQGGAPGAGERRATSGGRGQGRSGARMRGRLCVGRAAAAAAAVAVPLAGGQEGSPGGVRRGSRGTTMVKKRKGRVVIDSDTEDSGSDENLDQVRAGRGGAGRRSGRAESGPREPGAGRARGLPAGAPGPLRALISAAISFLSSPQHQGPSESGRGLESEPRGLGALGWEAGQGPGWWASGSGDQRGP